MAKAANDSVLDALLAKIATATSLTVCSAQPTTRTEAVTTYKLADVTLTAGDGNGDFTIANGDTSGRKVTVAIQSDIAIDASGTATHVALCDASSLLFVTTCTSQALTASNTVTVPAWDIEVGDPS
ncbi:MAG TPA: hypothetical protein VFL85_01515 [Candidatus Saccharimonadales bacterium]|nr:hypothetical protein [Candidatus Saccharimonadales bacterium]